MTKDDAKKLRGGFIPGVKPVDINTLVFRRTGNSEITRCCQPTSRDPQSGLIYCGDIAEYIAPSQGGYVALCERHRPPNKLLQQPALSL